MSRLARCNEILYDLLHIQQEKIDFYQQILNHFPVYTEATDLLQKIMAQSNAFVLSLRRKLDAHLGDPADSPEIKGEIYSQWDNQHHWRGGQINVTFHLLNHLSQQCEQIERATEDIYMKALTADAEMPQDSRSIIINQLKKIRRIFNDAREYKRDPGAFLPGSPESRMKNEPLEKMYAGTGF